jgi:hypothetical protein
MRLGTSTGVSNVHSLMTALYLCSAEKLQIVYYHQCWNAMQNLYMLPF